VTQKTPKKDLKRKRKNDRTEEKVDSTQKEGEVKKWTYYYESHSKNRKKQGQIHDETVGCITSVH